jgi:hypothetical protein
VVVEPPPAAEDELEPLVLAVAELAEEPGLGGSDAHAAITDSSSAACAPDRSEASGREEAIR